MTEHPWSIAVFESWKNILQVVTFTCYLHHGLKTAVFHILNAKELSACEKNRIYGKMWKYFLTNVQCSVFLHCKSSDNNTYQTCVSSWNIIRRSSLATDSLKSHAAWNKDGLYIHVILYHVKITRLNHKQSHVFFHYNDIHFVVSSKNMNEIKKQLISTFQEIYSNELLRI